MTTIEPSTLERLEALMERADVNGSQRLTFRSDPERSVRLLEYALSRPKLRNPAAFALTRFRSEQDAPGARVAVIDQQETILTRDDLERALAFAREQGAPRPAIEAIEAQLALCSPPLDPASSSCGGDDPGS